MNNGAKDRGPDMGSGCAVMGTAAFWVSRISSKVPLSEKGTVFPRTLGPRLSTEVLFVKFQVPSYVSRVFY